jgi:hypothetical protein
MWLGWYSSIRAPGTWSDTPAGQTQGRMEPGVLGEISTLYLYTAAQH